MLQETINKIMECLPATRVEICAHAGIKEGCFRDYRAELGQLGNLHVSGYLPRKGRGAPEAIYSAGPGSGPPPTIKQKRKVEAVEQYLHDLSIVGHAMATQPNSVFSLGALA